MKTSATAKYALELEYPYSAIPKVPVISLASGTLTK